MSQVELTEDDCGYARYCIETQSALLDTRKTNSAEDVLIQELATDIRLFADNWVAKRMAVEADAE